jgi:DNA-binding transcriptional regulator YdaS (Cro superfamily)
LKINCNKQAIIKATDLAGGNKALAEKLGVSYQSILNWKTGKSSPNRLHCLLIEKATEGQVSRKEIFPDYPWYLHKEDENVDI